MEAPLTFFAMQFAIQFEIQFEMQIERVTGHTIELLQASFGAAPKALEAVDVTRGR